MKGALSFLVGAVMGSLVGASLALLLAPMSGSALRTEVQERARTVTGEVQEAARLRRIELEKQLEQLRAPRRPGDIQVQ